MAPPIHSCGINVKAVKINILSATAILFLCCASYGVSAQDSISVDVNKNIFSPGDSITLEVSLYNYKSVAKTATIQLWVENIQTGRQWKFRYPLINGYINAVLKIDSSMPNGVYAFNFLLQKKFFSLTGFPLNTTKKDKFLNYVMISKSKQPVVDIIPLNRDQPFSIPNLLFQDSAFIIFSRPKQKNNDLLINIATPLDSAFVPAASHTKFITINNHKGERQEKFPDTGAYVFKSNDSKYKITLTEVVVKTKSNKKLQDFDTENTTGTFTGSDAVILDGLTTDEIANAPDLYTYLTIKVGGLQLVTDNSNGAQNFTWRNQPVDMYLNEIKLDPDIPVFINPSDIAMIKIFRPGTMLTADGGAGGAMAIYTKTGEYNKASNRKYSFYITGYTGLETLWKN